MTESSSTKRRVAAAGGVKIERTEPSCGIGVAVRVVIGCLESGGGVALADGVDDKRTITGGRVV